MDAEEFELDECDQDSDDFDQRPRRSFKKQCISCWKKFIAFLFSHIGLTCLVTAYTIFGGYIFKTIEEKMKE